ncbi:MAG TPA: tetratricopeptide repeat protein, partial [Candidatus Dormibacteraeota bacterium]|nr:tetratricopeptide repeat protein [Candidatus Dormibacteraeota bacterium]
KTVLDRYEREHDNVRAALSRAIAGQHAEVAMRILAACWRFWQMRGYLAEGREQAERALALPPGSVEPEVRGAALEAGGGLAYWQADMQVSRAWYAEALELARASGDDARIANALYNLSFTFSLISEDQEQARANASEAVEIYRRIGDQAGIGRSLWGLANSYYYFRDFAPGIPIVEEALQIFRRMGDRFMTAWGLYILALFELETDRKATRQHLEEALPLFTETEDKSSYGLIFDGFATLEWAEGDVVRAMRLAGYGAATERSAGTGLASLSREVAGFIPEALAEDPQLAAAHAEGQRITLEQATDLALHRHEPTSAEA